MASFSSFPNQWSFNPNMQPSVPHTSLPKEQSYFGQGVSTSQVGLPQAQSTDNFNTQMQKVIHYFGLPMHPIYRNPYDSYERENFDLPEAYFRDKLPYLSMIMIHRITEADAYHVRRMLPWKKWDSGNTITWEEWIFADHMLTREPEESVARLLTSSFNQNKATLIRYGIALILEHGFWNTPRGQKNFRMNMVQIQNATVMTACHSVQMALLNIDWDKLPARMKRPRITSSKDRDIQLEQEIRFWAALTKTPWADRQVIAHARQVIYNRTGSYGDIIQWPQGTSKYLNIHPEYSQFAINGQPGGMREDSLPPPGPGGSRPETQYEAIPFRVGEKMDDVNPSNRQYFIGEFTKLTRGLLSHIPVEHFRTSMGSLAIYSYTTDDDYYFEQLQLLRYSGLFFMGGASTPSHLGPGGTPTKDFFTTQQWRMSPIGIRWFAESKNWGDYLGAHGHLETTANSIAALGNSQFVDFLQFVIKDGQEAPAAASAEATALAVSRAPPAGGWVAGQSLVPGDALTVAGLTVDVDPKPLSAYGGGRRFPSPADAIADLNTTGGRFSEWAKAWLQNTQWNMMYHGGARSAAPQLDPVIVIYDNNDYDALFDTMQRNVTRDAVAPVAPGPGVVAVAGVPGGILLQEIANDVANRLNTSGPWTGALGVYDARNPQHNMDTKVVIGIHGSTGAVRMNDAPNNKLWYLADAYRNLGRTLVYAQNAVAANPTAAWGAGAQAQHVRANSADWHQAANATVEEIRTFETGWAFAAYEYHRSAAAGAAPGRLTDLATRLKEHVMSSIKPAADAYDATNVAQRTRRLALQAEMGKPVRLVHFQFHLTQAVQAIQAVLRDIYGNPNQTVGEYETQLTNLFGQLRNLPSHQYLDGSSADLGVAARLQFMENKRKVAAAQLPIPAEAKTEISQQFTAEYMDSNAEAFNHFPALYRAMPASIEAIFRRRVLAPSVNAYAGHAEELRNQAPMNINDFVYLMVLVEDMWKEDIRAAGLDDEKKAQANRNLATLLEEFYESRNSEHPGVVPGVLPVGAPAGAPPPPPIVGPVPVGQERDLWAIIQSVTLWRDAFSAQMAPDEFVTAARGPAGTRGGGLRESLRATQRTISARIAELGSQYFKSIVSNLPPTVRRGIHLRDAVAQRSARIDFSSARDLQRAIQQEDDESIRSGVSASAAPGIAAQVASELQQLRLLWPARKIAAALGGVRISPKLIQFQLQYHLFPIIFFSILRPHGCWIMGTMIYMAGNGVAGWMFRGHENFMLQNDATRKMIFGHFTLYAKPLVTAPQYIVHVENILPAANAYQGGLGHEVWDPLDKQDRLLFNQGDAMNKSCFIVPLHADEDLNRKDFDVRGHYPAHLTGEDEDAVTPHYAFAPLFRQLWGLHKEIKPRQGNSNFAARGRATAAQSTVIQGYQRTYKFEGQGQGGYNNVIRNKGHWGPKLGPGCAAVLNGFGTFVEQADFQSTKLGRF